MSVMFASNRGNSTTNFSENLLEFKAGRSTMVPGSAPGKNKVIAQPHKGLVFLKQSPDHLMHFYWKNRDTNKNELDLIIFPGDAEFLNIKECTDGRVYILKFKSSHERHIFWLQDSKTDKDDEICKKVNEYLNNPPAARTNAGGRGSGANGADMSASASALSGFAALNNALGGGEDMGALSSMDQNQIMQLLSLMNGNVQSDGILPQLGFNGSSRNSGAPSESTPSVGGRIKSSAGKPTTTLSANNSGKANVFDSKILSDIISQYDRQETSEGGQSSLKKLVDMNGILSRANVQDIVLANADHLIPHLPDQTGNQPDQKKELAETIGTPQFRQSAEFFGVAFQSGKLAPVLPHFGIKSEAVNAAVNGDLIQFAKKLTEQEGAQKNNSKDLNEEISQENESTLNTILEPKNKRSKTEDNMELD